MASTLESGTMKVRITEEITLNGRDQGSMNELSIGSINEISKRIVSVPTSEIEIIKMDTSAGAGQFIEGDVRYIRITNKDDTNNVFLTFKNEDNDEFAVLLDYGQSFIYNSNFDGGVVNTFDANAGAANINNLGDLVNITAQADTAAVDIEIFVASV
tara:strand:- start:856 stop:1326 length:471 start_codon:yes stop_codon:yes gene_type:complete